MPHTVYLVDASPYIFRGYFSLPESITGREGTPVNAVYGFVQFLLRLVDEEEVTHLALAFDKSLNTSFRNELYPDYKAQRALPPPELEAQLGWCEQIGCALGCETFIDERYEADDLIAALCDELTRAGHEVVIVTSDKDLAQLVDERVTLLDFARGERYGPAEVVEKFGVRPEQITDFLALAGDSVDNIPGVKGVGKKTAVALLEHFPDLETLYARLDEVRRLPLRGAKSLAAKLEASRDLAFLSKELATVARDAPARADVDRLRHRGPVAELLDPLFDELAFGRLRERIEKWGSG